MIKIARNILLFVLSIEIMWSIFFSEWEFSNYYLRIIETAALPFVFFAFLACVAGVREKSKYGFLFAGLYSLPIAIFFSWFFLHPLDSHSEEKDMAVVKNLGDNKKIITRKYFNYKHNVWQTDTVKVQEFFIFRKYLRD